MPDPRFRAWPRARNNELRARLDMGMSMVCAISPTVAIDMAMGMTMTARLSATMRIQMDMLHDLRAIVEQSGGRPVVTVPLLIRHDGLGGDVTEDLLDFFSTVPEDRDIHFPILFPLPLYRIDLTMLIEGRANCEIICNGATFYATDIGARNRKHWVFDDCENTRFSGATIIGANTPNSLGNGNPGAGMFTPAGQAIKGGYVGDLEAQHAVQYAGGTHNQVDHIVGSYTFGDGLNLTQNADDDPADDVWGHDNLWTHIGRQGVSAGSCTNCVLEDEERSLISRSHVDIEPNLGDIGTTNLIQRRLVVGLYDGNFFSCAGGSLIDVGDISMSQVVVSGRGAGAKVKGLGAIKAMTTVALPNSPVYNNGALGVGATLKATTNGTLAVDGVTPANPANPTNGDATDLRADFVLVNITAGGWNRAWNGPYEVTNRGSAGSRWTLTRCGWADKTSRLMPGKRPMVVSIIEGSHAGTNWELPIVNAGQFNVGTTAIVFVPSLATGVKGRRGPFSFDSLYSDFAVGNGFGAMSFKECDGVSVTNHHQKIQAGRRQIGVHTVACCDMDIDPANEWPGDPNEVSPRPWLDEPMSYTCP